MREFINLFSILTFIGITGISLAQTNEHDISSFSLDSLLNVKIISASKHWQKTFEAPSNVSVITSDEIDKYGYRSLDEVLNSLAGFYTSYDRNYSYLGTRGFSRPTDYNNRVLLLINDHPANEIIFGSSALGNDLSIPLNSIERIEVVRGPGSALYGTGAMFAVINIITKTGKSFDKTTLTGGVGNLGTYSGIINYGTFTENELDIFISGEYYKQRGEDKYFSQYDTDTSNHGIAADLDGENYYGMLATLTYKNFRLQGKLSNRNKYIPTAPYGVLFNDGRTKTEDGLNFLEAKYTYPLSETYQMSFTTSLNYYRYRGFWPYNNNYQKDKSDGVWWTLNMQNSWTMSSSNLLIYGFEFRKDFKSTYIVWNDEKTFLSVDHPISVFSFFAQDEFQIRNNLSLIGSLRLDNYTNAKTYLSPRAALVYNFLPETNLKFIVGSSLRVPSLYESYYEDASSNFKSNLSLTPERLTTGEFVLERRFTKDIYSTFSLYSSRVENLIDQKLNDVDSTLQYQNYSKVRVWGIDADINYSMSSGMRAFLRYSYQNASDISSDKMLSNAPLHLVKAGITAPIGKLLNTATEIIYESNRKCLDGSKTNSFVLANFTLSTNAIFNKLKLHLRIKNIFNTAYSYPGGYEHLMPSIAQDGRTYFLNGEFEF
jgi:outer membrane receptor for ferrienterochelin and colicins